MRALREYMYNVNVHCTFINFNNLNIEYLLKLLYYSTLGKTNI